MACVSYPYEAPVSQTVEGSGAGIVAVAARRWPRGSDLPRGGRRALAYAEGVTSHGVGEVGESAGHAPTTLFI